MKKFFGLLLAVMVMSIFCIHCFAETFGHDVYARYVAYDENCCSYTVNAGEASAMLSHGISIIVSGIPSDDYILHIKEIPENEQAAMQWFAECFSDGDKMFYPLDIYLTDGNDRVILTDSVDIQIHSSQIYIDAVRFLETTGCVTDSDCTMTSNGVSFESTLNGYCVLFSSEQQSLSPKTGDNGHLLIWTIATIGSLLVLSLLLSKKLSASKNN